MKKLIQFIKSSTKSIIIWRTSYVTEEEYQADRKKGKEIAKKTQKFLHKFWIWELIVGGGIIVIVILMKFLGIF